MTTRASTSCTECGKRIQFPISALDGRDVSERYVCDNCFFTPAQAHEERQRRFAARASDVECKDCGWPMPPCEAAQGFTTCANCATVRRAL